MVPVFRKFFCHFIHEMLLFSFSNLRAPGNGADVVTRVGIRRKGGLVGGLKKIGSQWVSIKKVNVRLCFVAVNEQCID